MALIRLRAQATFSRSATKMHVCLDSAIPQTNGHLELSSSVDIDSATSGLQIFRSEEFKTWVPSKSCGN